MKFPIANARPHGSCARLFFFLALLATVTGCGPSAGFKAELAKAKAGDPAAALAVGMMYLEGNLVKQDSAAGLDWIKQAAFKGFPAAQRQYGMILRVAPPGTPGADQSREWIEKAARQNDAAAQAELAGMLGVFAPPFDHVEALKWALLAEKNGLTNAPALQKMLEGQMTPSQIAQARARAAEFGKEK